jgi:L-arabinokinase
MIETALLGSEVDGFVTGCNGRLNQAIPYVVARAPARLDVMGGIAASTGSLVLQSTLGRRVIVGAQKRTDQQVSLTILPENEGEEATRLTWPLADLYSGPDELSVPQAFASAISETRAGTAQRASAILHAMLQAHHVRHFEGGVTLVIESTAPAGVGIGSSAAVEVATYRALAALFDVKFEPLSAARVCEAAGQVTGPGASRIADHVISFLGEPSTLLQIKCQPHQVLGPLRLPAGVKVVGVDSGVRHEKAFEKSQDTFIAASMGHRLILEAMREDGQTGDPTNGYLANLSPTDFVDRFRNRLPTRMKGREFLGRWGDKLPPMVVVDPEKIYKVRSRTEHHIYENTRAYQFVERVSRAARTGERDALVEAGQLMYSSHWSYSQRCGLGTIETDILLNLIRERGISAGLYGARVSGEGAGGTLAVMMDDTDDARAALDEAVESYQQNTGETSTVFDESSLGAMGFTPAQFNP